MTKRWRTIVVAIVLSGPSLSAQDQQDSPPKNGAEKKEKIDFYRKRLRELRLFVEDRGGKACEFVEDPLMRWDNPISQNGDGMMFLWTDRGRPVAMMNSHFHYPSRVWRRIFTSLATRPMEMRSGEQTLWNPRLAAVAFKPLDDVKPPAETAAARLVQLRNLAKAFQVVCHWGGKDMPDWQLRLLTTPLYRYQAPEEGVVDGALFGFIQSGPESVLLLEARKSPQGLEWHYTASRSTSYYVKISRNDTIVVEAPHLDQWTATDTFFGSRIPINDYPFGDPFANTKAANGAPPK